MKEFAAKEARNQFGLLLDTEYGEPDRVTEKGRPVGAMMSMQRYERLRGAAWERLLKTMDAIAAAAAENGLTDSEPESLLADASKECRFRHKHPDYCCPTAKRAVSCGN